MPLYSQVFLFIFLPIFSSIFFFFHYWKKNILLDDVLLVIGSLLFYSWGGKESLIYLLGISFLLWLYSSLSTSSFWHKKGFLFVVLIVVSLLIYAKYIAFFFPFWKEASVFSPLAISFISFTAISLASFILKERKPVPFLQVVLYLSLFPKMIAGPIVLWQEFQESCRNRKNSWDNTAEGVERLIIGYAKKVIIANTLGVAVSAVYAQVNGGVDTLSLWLLMLSYGMQLYFDFAGYSDMAIGLMLLFGFRIQENFRQPYQSKSVSEFWRRWHISLGSWFREYIYIPLGGNRRGNVYVHLFIVFLLTGLWHGAAFKYLLWGVSHGLVMMVERYFLRKENHYFAEKFFAIFCPIFVFFSWIPFSAPSLSIAIKVLRQMFSFTHKEVYFRWSYYFDYRVLFFLLLTLTYSFLYRPEKNKIKISGIWKYTLLLILFVVAVSFSVNGSYSPFLYARY